MPGVDAAFNGDPEDVVCLGHSHLDESVVQTRKMTL